MKQVFSKNPKMSEIIIDGEIIIYCDNLKAVPQYVLNETGVLIWNFIDGINSIETIIKIISDIMQPSDTIPSDVLSFIDELRNCDLICECNEAIKKKYVKPMISFHLDCNNNDENITILEENGYDLEQFLCRCPSKTS
jgi:hypothetical protein